MAGMYTTEKRADLLLRPTQETYDGLQQAYEFYNRTLFDDQLPNCLITLQRKRRTYGYFCNRRFVNSKGAHSDEIAMNPQYFQKRTLEETLSTLVHEMVHLWQYRFAEPGRGRYHNRQWAEKMKSIGLHPSNTGEVGGRELGDQMNHYVIEGGEFDRVTAELRKAGFIIEWRDGFAELDSFAKLKNWKSPAAPKAGKRVKYSCPQCGLNAWARHEARLVCGFDGTVLEAS